MLWLCVTVYIFRSAARDDEKIKANILAGFITNIYNPIFESFILQANTNLNCMVSQNLCFYIVYSQLFSFIRCPYHLLIRILSS